MQARQLTRLALISAMALAVHAIEGMLPPPFPAVPGVRLGLANVFTLYVLAEDGFSWALMVLVVRVVLGALVGGAPTALVYGLSGGLLAMLAMYASRRLLGDKISLIGVSVLGAAFHSVGQIAAARVMLGTDAIFAYLPAMLLLSIPMGVATGLLCSLLLSRLSKT